MAAFSWNLIAHNERGVDADVPLGDDLQVSYTWQTDGGVAGAPIVPVDLTGWTGQIQFFRAPTDTIPFQAADISLGGTAGTLAIFVPGATMRSWFTRGVYFHAEVLTSPGGLVYTLVRGLLEIS